MFSRKCKVPLKDRRQTKRSARAPQQFRQSFADYCKIFYSKTPSSWAEETRGRRSVGGHKRSASWGSAEHLREASTLIANQFFLTHTHILYLIEKKAALRAKLITFLFQTESFFSPLCPQVAKLRHQLQKRSRHAPPSGGCEPPSQHLPAGHAAGTTQVAQCSFLLLGRVS